jgi:imidazole glycerol-phosphate synthase subunit HisH
VIISVVDYGAGNVGAVIRMIERAGGAARRVSTAPEVLSAEKLILPGVGAFDHGMAQLEHRGLVEPLREAVLQRGIPALGICLGMQLVCASSEEGDRPGLGWVDAEVVRFPAKDRTGLNVPHMGWNTLDIVRDSPLLPRGPGEQRFYFVHSYYVRTRDAALPVATASYGSEFVAAFQQGNIHGVQFHPEKSHRFGLQLIRRFLEMPGA